MFERILKMFKLESVTQFLHFYVSLLRNVCKNGQFKLDLNLFKLNAK